MCNKENYQDEPEAYFAYNIGNIYWIRSVNVVHKK